MYDFVVQGTRGREDYSFKIKFLTSSPYPVTCRKREKISKNKPEAHSTNLCENQWSGESALRLRERRCAVVVVQETQGRLGLTLSI